MSRITLTFDNGPDPDVTPLVLDTLDAFDIKSTFFVLGEKLRDRAWLIERAHEEGHWIGNHTYSHLVPLGMAAEPGIAIREIASTQELIGELAHERRFFRPFGNGGELDARLLNAESVGHLQENGFTCVLWNVIARDWLRPNGWVDQALKLCLAQDHALLVLHDLPTGAMDHLGHFITAAIDAGAVFEQDFPDSCMPIQQGRTTGSIERYVNSGQLPLLNEAFAV